MHRKLSGPDLAAQVVFYRRSYYTRPLTEGPGNHVDDTPATGPHAGLTEVKIARPHHRRRQTVTGGGNRGGAADLWLPCTIRLH